MFATGRIAFIRNLLSNLAVIAANAAIGIFFVRYLVRELGEQRYGFLPLAANVLIFLSIVTNSFALVINRDLTVEMEINPKRANSIFNSALAANILFGAAFLLPAIFLAVFPESIFRVPDEISGEVGALFAFVAAAFFLTTTAIAFQSVAQARNRLDLYNGVTLLHRAVRVSATVALFAWISPTLIAAGWALLAAGVVELAGHIVCWKKVGAGLKISPGAVQREVFAPMVRRSGWIMLSTLGAFLFLGADIILVNRLLGTEATTSYALAVQWSVFLRMFAGALSGTVHPTTVRLHATAGADKMCEHIQRSVKFVGYATAIGAAIFCGFAQPFLRIWLGPEFERLAPLVMILVAPLGLILAVMPMYSVALAANRVRVPAFAGLALGLTGAGLIVWAAGPMNWGLIGVAAAVTIAIFLYNVIFTPIYTARILGVPAARFYTGLMKVTAAAAIFFALAKGATALASPDSWLGLCIYGVVLGTLFSAVAIFGGLNRHDRLSLKGWIAGDGVKADA